jgi:putative sterol carrier protein
MVVKESIQQMIDKFHSRVEKDEKMREELSGILKKVNIDLGSEKYSFILDDGRIHSFQDGLLDDVDIKFISDPETMEGLISRKIKPMKALALRKLRVKGDIEDLMRFRKFF